MEPYYVSTDKAKLDISLIHHFLAEESYWAKNIPLTTVKKTIGHSLCFGVYCKDEQVGYARVVTDQATIAYLGDVFIVPAHRGKGLSKFLMNEIMQHPELRGLRRWILLTADAHGLYKQFGWVPIAAPERWMEIFTKDIYSSQPVSP